MADSFNVIIKRKIIFKNATKILYTLREFKK